MKNSSNKIKELLLIDLEHVYAKLANFGYKKYYPDQLNKHSDALLQRKHEVRDSVYIFFNIYAYKPIGPQKEPSFEAEICFESDTGYWAKVQLYSFKASYLIQNLSKIESDLIASFNTLNGRDSS